MKDGQLVRVALVVVLAIQAAFLISTAFAVHSFFNSTDGGDAPGGAGTSILVMPSPLVLLAALTGLVFAGGAIGAWLRWRTRPVLRRTSTVLLVLAVVPNVVVLAVVVVEGLWVGVAVGPAGINLALLYAEWRATHSSGVGDSGRAIPPKVIS